MNRARYPARARRQRGYAVLVALVFLVMGSLTYLVSAVGKAANSSARDVITRAALARAKEALIARSTQASQGPGHLVCPDTTNEGMWNGGSCDATPAERIGRLPWKTLDIPELRDASGETLWYVLSGSFINTSGHPINSDSEGELTVNGLTDATEIIAIIFAPGIPLDGQSRGTDEDRLAVSNYLEGENGDAADDLFEVLAKSASFNDQLIVIRREDLFPHVENIVSARLRNEIGAMLRFYRDGWERVGAGSNGFYPYASPFVNPGEPAGFDFINDSTTFCGAPSVNRGFLPLNTKCLDEWNANGTTITAISGSFTSTPSCTPDTTPADRLKPATCTFQYSDAMTVRLVLPKMGRAARTLAYPDISIKIDSQIFSPSWSTTITVTPSNGDIDLVLETTLPVQSTIANVQINVAGYFAHQRFAELNNISLDWFYDNGWFRHVYYAVAQSRMARTSPATACAVATDCLRVTTEIAQIDNGEAVLVLAGRILPERENAGFVRPSWNSADYFEGLNTPSNPLDYQSNRSNFSFNDRLTMVAP